MPHKGTGNTSPSMGLIALACGTFALGLAEFSMMGILSPLAASLHVSISDAGDFISAYAFGVSIGAPLPLFFRKYPYKYILLGLCAGIALGNFLVSAASGYWSMILFRFLSGFPHGAYFGVGAIFATHLVEPGRRATAVAIMVCGMTLANLAGVPAGTWLANTFSWRWTYAITAMSGLVAFLGIFFFTPAKNPGPAAPLRKTVHFLKGFAPWLIFLATFLGQGSLYCWYSYMEPILLQISHVPPHYMKWVMIVAGLGMVTGNLSGGRLADRFHPALVSAVTAVLIVPILLGIYLFSAQIWLAIFLVFCGAAALFTIGGPMQYLIVRFSHGGEILGGAGIQIAFNVSNAIAAWGGGMAISAHWGLLSTTLLGIPAALACAAILFWFYNRYGKIKL